MHNKVDLSRSHGHQRTGSGGKLPVFGALPGERAAIGREK